MPPKIMAVIPARSRSKSVPNKNVREIGGSPLMAWSIAAAKSTGTVDRVIVSTDSEEYAALARSYGAEAPFLRPAEISGDLSTDLDFFLHLVEWLQKNEGTVPDYFLHLRPTCPNRAPEIIDSAVATILSEPEATSLLCAHGVDYPPCKYFKMVDGKFSGYMGEEYVNIPRQACEKAYIGNGYADLLKVESLMATRNLYGPSRMAFLTPNPGDIDTEDEFLEMDLLLHRSHSPLREYLLRAKASMRPRYMEAIDTLSVRMPELAAAKDSLLRATDMIVGCVKGGGKVIVAGNGGSCADALHFSGELLKSFLVGRPVDSNIAAALAKHPFGLEMTDALEVGVPVVVLGQNSALVTAYLNDRKDSRAYLAQECLALAQPGDVLVTFSTSGESEALLWAMAAMQAKGGKNISFTGKGGGRMGAMAEIEVRSPASETPLVQEHHLPLYHVLCDAVESELFTPCHKKGQ